MSLAPSRVNGSGPELRQPAEAGPSGSDAQGELDKEAWFQQGYRSGYTDGFEHGLKQSIAGPGFTAGVSATAGASASGRDAKTDIVLRRCKFHLG